MGSIWFAVGGFFALLAVGLGAFGAHALSGRLAADAQSIYETGVRYQMYHALALLAAAYAVDRWGGTLPVIAGALFVAGILLFSGSLYALSLSGVKILGAVTPFGGLAFLAGWACLIATPFRG
jgi:uncharacterized membrane protein YgdD (TMEM256/DUF423 family)